MSRQEVQGKEGEDIGRVPGEKVKVHWLVIERDDGEKAESKNEGCKVSFGGEVFSLPGLRVEKRRRFSSVLQRDYRKNQRNLQAEDGEQNQAEQ